MQATIPKAKTYEEKAKNQVRSWVGDWNKFAYDALGARLDTQQQEILSSVQYNPRTSVASGTARGKDFVTAVASLCFLYLTPKWDTSGRMTENTKVALTAPTARQISNIMKPEFSRLYREAIRKGVDLPGRLVSSDIRTDYEEWFLTGFKADEYNIEAWTGFHASNTMFAITEASGIPDVIYDAIEGNLQGNSRILLVFNPNRSVGYAARSQKGERWTKFRLNSLDAPNVIQKKITIPGQVDYDWITDKLENWCTKIRKDEVLEEQDDFEFEGQWYRPEDVFRIKVLGKFPKVSEDALIPEQWIELAEERWKIYHEQHGQMPVYPGHLKVGADVAGMGRDSSCNTFRFDNIVSHRYKSNSGGKADHMETAGKLVAILNGYPDCTTQIDTIGEGAGVYSRLVELGYEDRAYSCKYSEGAADEQGRKLTDITGQYNFANMRAYLFWAVRDWLNPKNNMNAMLPPAQSFKEEAVEIQWKFQSNGNVIIEPKEDIKTRLGRSTDEFDSLANTFYPETKLPGIQDLSGFF